MAETSCEVITIPKKALRMTNSEILLKTKEHETVGFVREELRKKEEWVDYKNALMENLMKMIEKEKGKMVWLLYSYSKFKLDAGEDEKA